MAGDSEKLHAREKVVQQMGRDGLVEENLARGTVQNISSRQADFLVSAGEGEPAQAHDRSQNRSHFHADGQEGAPQAGTVPEPGSLQGAAGKAAPRTPAGPVPETAAEQAAEAAADMPSPLPAEFAGFAGRMARINADGETGSEDGENGDGTLEKAGRLADHRNRKLKEAGKRETGENRKPAYGDTCGEEEGEEKEGVEGGNGRLKEDDRKPLKFQKERKTTEKKKGNGNRGKRLRFDGDGGEETGEDGETPAGNTGKRDRKGGGKEGEKEKKGKGKGEREKEDGEGGRWGEEEGGRLKFGEKGRRGSPAGWTVKAAGRNAMYRFAREQEEELDPGAETAFRAGRWAARGMSYADGKKRLRKARQGPPGPEKENGRLKERGQVREGETAREAERENRRLPEHGAARGQLKEGSRYLKERERRKQDMKKAYQRKANMRKSMEAVQGAVKNSARTAAAKKAAAQAAAAVKSLLLPACGILLVFLLLVFLAGYLGTELAHMGAAGTGAYYGGLYQSTYSDMTDCEAYYRELEAGLEEMIAGIKGDETYGDCHEFVYDLGNVGHRAVDLMSYLATKYTDFTLEMCRDELDSLFEEMYRLEVEVREEEREVEMKDADGNLIYDADGNPVTERKPVKICYVTLTVKPWDEIMEGRLTPGEAERYGVFLMSQGGQQVYGNPLMEDWKDKISSPYGYRIHPITHEKTLHAGVDIAVPVGTPLFSSTAGTVVTARYSESAGNFIEVRTESGYTVRYLHLDSLGVSAGDTVEKGALIGATGNTGRSTGPHLHLEVRTPEGRTIDPTFITSNGRARGEGEEAE